MGDDVIYKGRYFKVEVVPRWVRIPFAGYPMLTRCLKAERTDEVPPEIFRKVFEENVEVKEFWPFGEYRQVQFFKLKGPRGGWSYWHKLKKDSLILCLQRIEDKIELLLRRDPP